MAPSLRIRWSEFEAAKSYARPFMVSFSADGGADAGSVAVSGADLLYYRQFQAAVLALGGELFTDPTTGAGVDPQRAWLERVRALLPAAGDVDVSPESTFDERHGRVFGFVVRTEAGRNATLDAHALLEYQEFQAALAHQTGCLFHDADVEAIDDPASRREAWMSRLRSMLRRPGAGEAMSETWPWR